jgi:thiamine biosynthesis lipoprotein
VSLTRRRLLQISAAAASTGLAGSAGHARSVRWDGVALGADVSIRLDDPDKERARNAIHQARKVIRRMEGEFSLYDPGSALCRLNRDGRLVMSADFGALMTVCEQVHRLSLGLFDPTVQPLWSALARGLDPAGFRHLVGFEKVRIGGGTIRLAPGMALTLNGIAQGYATDKVADLLQSLGYRQALVNIGEYRALGGPYRIQELTSDGGTATLHELRGSALATSQPRALLIGREADQPHILHPKGAFPTGIDTVTVCASSAAIADGLSTALCLADGAETDAICDQAPIDWVTIRSVEGLIARAS